MGKNSVKFNKVEKVPRTFSIFPPLHSSNSLGDCWRLQIKETRFPSLGYLWSLKSEQRCQSTTASYCYFYQASKAGQCLSSLFFAYFSSNSWIKSSMAAGSVLEEKRWATWPCRSMTNFAKFHSMRLPSGPAAWLLSQS